MSDGEFSAPSPLTPAQRYHLEVYGYVVVENAIEQDLTGRLLEAMLRLKRDLLSAPDPPRPASATAVSPPIGLTTCTLPTSSKPIPRFSNT